jgi:hypothetical protein
MIALDDIKQAEADGGKRKLRSVEAGDVRELRVGRPNAIVVFGDGLEAGHPGDDNRGRQSGTSRGVHGALIISVKEKIGGHLQGCGRGECGKTTCCRGR